MRYEPKRFLQRKPNGKGGYEYKLGDIHKPLYRLPELLISKYIIICEGEKDCDNVLAALKGKEIAATTNFDGAGKWRDEDSVYLAGKQVVIVADCDEIGRKHAQRVAASIHPHAVGIRIVKSFSAERFEHDGNEAALLFPPSYDYDATDTGMMRFLSIVGPPANDEPLRFADAVAVAGVRAVTGGQRRAVVYILSGKPDTSRSDPAAVRRYLASLGVPLFVWSVSGPRPDAAESWGDVQDVSSLPKLGEAVNRIRKTLQEQRIAWVDVDPLTALRLEANHSCGIEVVAVGR